MSHRDRADVTNATVPELSVPMGSSLTVSGSFGVPSMTEFKMSLENRISLMYINTDLMYLFLTEIFNGINTVLHILLSFLLVSGRCPVYYIF
jgi:hypothetical protein